MAIDIRKPLKKILPHLLQAQAENLNEADTVLRLIKFCEDVLGYDAMTEISREAEMKKQYVDIVLKVDGVIRVLLEAKAAGETLRDRHIDQATAYAAKNNYQWVILTNGVVWNLYHLTFGDGIEYERAFSVNLADSEKLESVRQRFEKHVPEAVEVLDRGFAAATQYYAFPRSHWKKIRTTNGLERLHGEIKRRTRSAGAFPDRASALRLITAVALRVTAIWGTRRYLGDMRHHFKEELKQAA